MEVQQNSWEVCDQESGDDGNKYHGHFIFCLSSLGVVGLLLGRCGRGRGHSDLGARVTVAFPSLVTESDN